MKKKTKAMLSLAIAASIAVGVAGARQKTKNRMNKLFRRRKSKQLPMKAATP